MTRMTFYKLWFLLAVTIGCGGKQAASPGSGSAPSASCQPVTCEIACSDGFKKDANGCEICECAAACEPVTCELYCENGYTTNADGCEICSCK